MLGLTSVSVFLFSALALAVGSGYSLGVAILLLASIWLLWKRPKLGLQKNDCLLIGVLLLYFLFYTTNMLFHGDPTRELDMPLRALLAVPVLLLLLAYPPRPAAWWSGIAVGVIAGAILCFWQLIILHQARPQAATSNAIHYGNVSMLLGMLSLAGLDWASRQGQRHAWSLLMGLACLAGIAGSIVSGSRGGWVALPVCLILFAIYRCKKQGKRYICSILLVLGALLVMTYFIPHSPVPERTAIAIAELKKFEHNGDVNSSVGERLEMWNNALVVSGQHIWLGMGRSGYMAQKKTLTEEGKMSMAVRDYTNAHNDYLDALVKRGIFGVMILLALFLAPLVLFMRVLQQGPAAAQPYALAGAMLCICYLVFGLTTSSLTLNIGIIMLIFPMVILWAMLRQQQRLAC